MSYKGLARLHNTTKSLCHKACRTISQFFEQYLSVAGCELLHYENFGHKKRSRIYAAPIWKFTTSPFRVFLGFTLQPRWSLLGIESVPDPFANGRYKLMTEKYTMTKHASQPVFIVGMNGSGTTMLLDCLNSHSQLYGYSRETKILPYYISILSKYGDLKDDSNFLRLFSDVSHEHIFRRNNKGKAIPLPENWRQLPRTLTTVIDSIFMYFASMEGKRRWCEKSPTNILHMSSLSQLFPGAKFVHIIRDGRACAASFHRRWHYTPEFTMYRWKIFVREGRARGATLGDKFFEIFYEDLTRSPKPYMRELCNFLGVPFEEATLHVSRASEFTPSPSDKMVNYDKIISNPRRWRTYFSDKQLERLERIGGSLLCELGYPTRYPESDLRPPRLSLMLWFYKDFLKRELPTLIRTITKLKSRKRFFGYLSKLKISLKVFWKNR